MHETNNKKAAILYKATFRAIKELKLTQSDFEKIAGLKPNAVLRMKNQGEIDPKSKTGEFALLFVRLYRSLYALNGGNIEWMLSFLNSKNKITRGIPIEQIQTIEGLVRVNQILDGLRSKI